MATTITMKTVTISDVGCVVVYSMNSFGQFFLEQDAGTGDVLNDNGIDIDPEGMTDEEIEQAVYDCWVEGYEGGAEGAEENCLSVTVS